MRLTVTMFLFTMLIVGPSYAADEFGSRFGTAAPAALSDPAPTNPDALAFTPEQLQSIETAAGETKVPEKFGPPVPLNLPQKNITAPQQ